MPTFTIKEIEKHRLASGKKRGIAISKTLERGRKFKEERYLSSDNDNVYTKHEHNCIIVKAKCKASMKKLIRNMLVKLNKRTGTVEKASCSCPAGASGYCNHIMALLFELADYSLKQLEIIPDEPACTSQLRKWGVPGETKCRKEPVMITSIQKRVTRKGINCTLYDPRINFDHDKFTSRYIEMQQKLRNTDERIGFAHCITPIEQQTLSETKYGVFTFGSPLSYHLQAVEFNYKILTNIEKQHTITKTVTNNLGKLPYLFIDSKSELVPIWQPHTDIENRYLCTLAITPEQAHKHEEDTVLQSRCKLWHELRAARITSSNAHKVYIRKKNFETLVKTLLDKTQSYPKMVQEAIKHGTQHEPLAREKYCNVLKFQLQVGAPQNDGPPQNVGF